MDKGQMKHTMIDILAIAFFLCCHYWGCRRAYIEGYKQAIRDEIEYIQSQTDSIKCEIRLLDRAIEKYRTYGMDKD